MASSRTRVRESAARAGFIPGLAGCRCSAARDYVAAAAPLALLDRDGSHVSIEAYAPTIVRVTRSIDKDLALAPPGFGIVAAADSTGWKHRTLAAGDEFSSDGMS